MLPVVGVEEMRDLERRGVEQLGLTGAAMMERAGRGAAGEIARLLPRGGRGARVAVVCGKGGNGGDGFVVARDLKRRGARVSVWLTAPPEEMRDDAAVKLAAMRRGGVPAKVIGEAPCAEPSRTMDHLFSEPGN